MSTEPSWTLRCWHVHYTFEEHQRRPTFGGMDSELTGEVVDREAVWTVVCTDALVAEALFRSKHSADYKVVGVRQGVRVDAVLQVQTR